MYETLKLTNILLLKTGDLVNIEEPIRFCDKIEGHLMTGHVDCTGKIKKIINSENNKIIWIKINSRFQEYIIQQGSIGIDGISLTINKAIDNYIRICLTPYTIANTTLGIKRRDSIVNVEIDIFVKSMFVFYSKRLCNINYIKINKIKHF